jgi:hypothetical protein
MNLVVIGHNYGINESSLFLYKKMKLRETFKASPQVRVKMSSASDHSRLLFIWLGNETQKLLLISCVVVKDKALPVQASFKTVSGFQLLAFKVPLLLNNGEGRLQSTLWLTS